MVLPWKPFAGNTPFAFGEVSTVVLLVVPHAASVTSETKPAERRVVRIWCDGHYKARPVKSICFDT